MSSQQLFPVLVIVDSRLALSGRVLASWMPSAREAPGNSVVPSEVLCDY